MKNAILVDTVKANKLLKEMKEAALVKLLKLNEHLSVIAYHDVSDTNLKVGGSQGRHFVLVTNKWQKYFLSIA